MESNQKMQRQKQKRTETDSDCRDCNSMIDDVEFAVLAKKRRCDGNDHKSPCSSSSLPLRQQPPFNCDLYYRQNQKSVRTNNNLILASSDDYYRSSGFSSSTSYQRRLNLIVKMCLSLLIILLLLASTLPSANSSPIPSSSPSFSSQSHSTNNLHSTNSVRSTASSYPNLLDAVYSTHNLTVNFTHLALDPRSGKLYVGASNWIYQFNSSLEMEIALETGPIPDSPLCSAADCSDVDPAAISNRNNINKVLLVDEHSNKLIVCGTVHQGSCRRHNLNGINTHEELIPVPVAANDENSSTLAFIGPARYFGSRVQPVLYVASTNSRLGPYRELVPAISSRSLEKFNILEKSFNDIAKVDIEFHMKDYYLVNYVYGFPSNDHIYFATVQKKSHLRALEEWGYITRLARVCQSDAGYNTYTEITLQCMGSDGTDYTLLQDATVVKAGEDLANNLQIAVGEQVLVGVFATSIDHTSHASSRSALCVYSISEIEQKFTENIHLCYNGSVTTRNMDYIAGNVPECPSPGRGGNIISFCAETLKLNGSIPKIGRAHV